MSTQQRGREMDSEVMRERDRKQGKEKRNSKKERGKNPPSTIMTTEIERERERD